MFVKSVALVILIVVAASHAQLQTVNGRIKITTVTTAGCGDTVNFISQQLAPAYSMYGDLIDLEFVPWGRTQRNADGSLSCQFGLPDCWANRVHRCVLDKLRDNQAAQMHYMTCEFSTPYPSFLQGSYLCAQAIGVPLVELDYCVASSEGDVLDVAAESLAQQPMQIIDFVPSIVFNDQINSTLHTQALTTLESMICFALAEDASTGIANCIV